MPENEKLKRPWVTPQEVRDYSEFDSVQKRTDVKLTIDISRAEQYVIDYTHNTFEECSELPSSVRTAVILLAELYAHNAVERTKQLKSETFDDYSYTAESTILEIKDLDLSSLLDEYVNTQANGTVTMRMRKL